jgi:tetratricopeptide (TPR) repeat protein
MNKKHKAIQKTTHLSPQPILLNLDWKYVILLVLIGSIVWHPVLKNAFVNWDDGEYLVKNLAVQKPFLSNFWELVTYKINNFHVPLTLLSFHIEFAIFGLKPFPYHLNNLLLHLANVVLVYYLAKRLIFNYQSQITENKPINTQLFGFIVALVFAVHPMNVESVAWVTERKDLLSTFFLLLSINYYLSAFYHSQNILQSKNYWLAFLCFILSLLAKPQAIFLPIILLLIDYFLDVKKVKLFILQKIPFFLISLLVGIYLLTNVGTKVLAYLPTYSFFDRILFSFYQLALYIFKFFFPIKLSAYYAYPASNAIPILYYIIPFVWIGLIALIYWKFRTNRLIIFGSLFYLFNVIMFMQIFSANTSLAYERFNYLAYFGLYLIGVYYIFHISTWQYTWIVFSLYMSILCLMTFQRTQIWKDDKSLFTDMIQKNPSDFEMQKIAAKSLGEYANTHNDFQEAIVQYGKLIALDANITEGHLGRGFAYSNTGNLLGAIQDFSNALKCRMSDSEKINILFNRGTCLMDLKQFQPAINDYSVVIQFAPNSIGTYQNRALCFENLKQYDKAIADYQQIIKLGGGTQAIYNRIQKLQNL